MKPIQELEPWVSTLLNASIQAALLVPLILVIQWLLKDRLAARWRHALWWVVVLRLMLPVSISSPLSLFNFADVKVQLEGSSYAQTASEIEAHTPLDAESVGLNATANGIAAVHLVEDGRTERVPQPERFDVQSSAVSTQLNPTPRAPELNRDHHLLRALVVAWLAGMLGLGALVAWQSLRFAKRLRRSEKRVPVGVAEMMTEAMDRMNVRRSLELIETSAVSSPVLYGPLRLRILLPLGFVGRFRADELRHVLLHELSHVKRRDIWINWLVTALQMVHWFNPFVWFAFARMRADRELACDEMALVKSGESNGSEYGRTIVKLLEDFARPAAMPGLVGILEDKKLMERRIKMIAKFQKPKRWSAMAILLVAVLGVVALTDAQTGNQVPAPAPLEAFTKIDLTPYYEAGRRTDFDAPDRGWENFPKGDQEFLGIPFSARGFVLLYGRAVARIKNFELHKIIRDLPVERKFQKLYMLQASAFRTKIGTVTANVRLNYADGSWSMLPIVYGEQNADWWRSIFEPLEDLDENTRVAWTAGPSSDRPSEHANRIFLTRFDNPHPEKRVSSVSVLSTGDEASVLVVGITVGRALTEAELAALPVIVEPTAQRDATIAIKLVQGQSLAPVKGIQLKASGVIDRLDVHLDEATVTGEDGIAQVSYSSRMNRLTIAPISSAHASVSARWDALNGQQIPPEYTLKLSPAQELSGVVVDEAGQFIPEAEVRVYCRDVEDSMNDGVSRLETYAQLFTDDQGRWRTRAFIPDAKFFTLTVTHEKYSQANFITETAPENYGGDRVPLSDLQNGTAVFTLSSGASLSGWVVDASGQPIKDALVAVGDTRFSGDRRTGNTDVQGRFDVSGLKESDLVITVQADGYAPIVKRFAKLSDAGQSTFRLEPGHVYAGRITDEQGNPLSNVRIVVESWKGNRSLEISTVTDPDGIYQLASMPDGDVEFYIGKTGYLQMRGVQPSPGGNNNYVLKEATKIVGNVTDAETGEPIPSFTVVPGEKSSPGSRPYWRETSSVRGEEGQFSFDINEGTSSYVFRVEADDYIPQLTEEVSANSEVTELNVSMRKGTGPGGIVVGVDGLPIPGVQMAFGTESRPVNVASGGFQNVGNSAAAQATTDAQGRFKFQPQADGKIIVANGPSGFGSVAFVEGQLDYRIELQPLGAISGVLIAPGFDVAEQGIMLTSVVPAEGDQINFNYGSFKTTTDSNGRFMLRDVPPGERRLVWLLKTAENSYAHTLPHDVLIKPGETVEVVMEQSGRVVIGTVRLSDPDVPVNWQQGYIGTIPPKPNEPLRTQEEAKAWNDSPEMQSYRKNARYHRIFFNDDGTFKSMPVDPGSYRLFISGSNPESVDRFGRGREHLGSINREIVVPDGDGEFDLGLLEVPYYKPLMIGDPAPEFVALDAAGQPFSLDSFEGRKVMLQFGGVNHFRDVPEQYAEIVQATMQTMKDVDEAGRAYFVALIREEDFESSVKVVNELQLPIILGVVDSEKLEQLQREYTMGGLKIVGPDGRISDALVSGSPQQRSLALRNALMGESDQ